MARSNKSRYALLGILSLEAASGYDIKKRMAQSTNYFWREGDSSIYPILKQLLEEGMVSCKIHNIESGKPKKVYSITLDGQRELQNWLLETPELLQSRNELLLKVFFGCNVEAKVMIKHIEKFSDQLKVKLAHYQNIAQTIFLPNPSGPSLYQFLTLKSGIIHTEASLQWCEESLSLLNRQ